MLSYEPLADLSVAAGGGASNQGARVSGQQQHESATHEAEVHVNALANEVDRLRPGWRRKRMQDFINFRHLLESEPYRSSLHTYTHPTQHAVVVQLRPQAREAVRAARDKQELARARAEGAGPVQPDLAQGIPGFCKGAMTHQTPKYRP